MVYQTNFCADTLNGSLASLQKYFSPSCAVALSHQRGSGLKLPLFTKVALFWTSATTVLFRVSAHVQKYSSTLLINTWWLDAYNLLLSKPHGLRRGLSTTTQVIEFVHDLSKTINSRGQTDVAYLDFAKAIDKASHSKLLFKIDKTFQNNLLTEWFSSYLAN